MLLVFQKNDIYGGKKNIWGFNTIFFTTRRFQKVPGGARGHPRPPRGQVARPKWHPQGGREVAEASSWGPNIHGPCHVAHPRGAPGPPPGSCVAPGDPLVLYCNIIILEIPKTSRKQQLSLC
jgi:hypothetical protein